MTPYVHDTSGYTSLPMLKDIPRNVHNINTRQKFFSKSPNQNKSQLMSARKLKVPVVRQMKSEFNRERNFFIKLVMEKLNCNSPL